MCAMPRRQNWKRRWFVLLDRQLIYYETEEVESFFFLGKHAGADAASLTVHPRCLACLFACAGRDQV